MNKKKIGLRKIIITEGFSFSGSGLLNDILINNGYYAPKNIRLSELKYSKNEVSWPSLMQGNYSRLDKLILGTKIAFRVPVRILKNFFQKTRLYNFYLKFKSRNIGIHESTSVNRDPYSLLLSICLLFRKEFNQELFHWWFLKKFKRVIYKEDKLLLDKGLSDHEQLIDWQLNFKDTIVFIVYRKPLLQFLQIKSYNNSKSNILKYEDFLKGLLNKYEMAIKLIYKYNSVIPVDFDKLAYNKSFRNDLFVYLNKNKFLDSFNYDFSETISNNEKLIKISRKSYSSMNSEKLEAKIIHFQHKFFKLFKEKVSG